MRIHSIGALATIGLAASLHAQSLALPQAPNNTGSNNGGVYFDLTVNQVTTFTSISYFCSRDATGTHQSSLEVYVGPGTWQNNVGTLSLWTLVASTTPSPITGGTGALGSGPTQQVTGVLNPAGVNTGTLTFLPGTYGIALKAVNHHWRYQNATSLQTYSNPDMTVVAGGASNAFVSLPTFSPRVFCGTLNYTLGGTPMPFAQREPYGAGCYRNFRSFYELFPSSVFVDLSNTSMLLTYDGTNNRYLVSGGTTPVDTGIATSPNLALLDNENRQITLANSQPIIFPDIGGVGIAQTTVEMSSNGYVTLRGTAPATANPTSALWLNDPAVRVGNWVNLNPAAGGTCHYDYDLVNIAHVFTWLNVPLQFVTGTSNTFQMAFFANGNVELRWGVMSVSCGGTCPTLIGFSPGHNSADPGSMDLSAALPATFATQGIDQPALALTANVNPVLNATVNLTTSNVTGLNLGICFVTVANLAVSPAGLDLGIIGAPGCVANVDINAGVGNLISNLGTPLPGLTVAFPIPSGPPAIIGQSFYCQSAWLDATQNALGIITSNAVRLKVGAF